MADTDRTDEVVTRLYSQTLFISFVCRLSIISDSVTAAAKVGRVSIAGSRVHGSSMGTYTPTGGMLSERAVWAYEEHFLYWTDGAWRVSPKPRRRELRADGGEPGSDANRGRGCVE